MSGDAAHPCGADGLAGISGATERYARIGRATAMRGESLMFHRYPGYPGRRPPCQNTAFSLLSFTSVSLRVLCSLRTSAFVLVLVACAVAGCSLSAQTPPQTGATPTPTAGLAPVASTTPAAALTYAAIGASESYGVGTTHPASDNWPTVLSRQLGSSVHVLNLGIPGATVALALREEAPIAVDAAPNIVTVWLGINDLDTGTPLDRFSADLRAL